VALAVLKDKPPGNGGYRNC